MLGSNRLSRDTPKIQVQKPSELMPVKNFPSKTSVMSGYLVMGFEMNPLCCAQIPVDESEVVFCCAFLL